MVQSAGQQQPQQLDIGQALDMARNHNLFQQFSELPANQNRAWEFGDQSSGNQLKDLSDFATFVQPMGEEPPYDLQPFLVAVEEQMQQLAGQQGGQDGGPQTVQAMRASVEPKFQEALFGGEELQAALSQRDGSANKAKL